MITRCWNVNSHNHKQMFYSKHAGIYCQRSAVLFKTVQFLSVKSYSTILNTANKKSKQHNKFRFSTNTQLFMVKICFDENWNKISVEPLFSITVLWLGGINRTFIKITSVCFYRGLFIHAIKTIFIILQILIKQMHIWAGEKSPLLSIFTLW